MSFFSRLTGLFKKKSETLPDLPPIPEPNLSQLPAQPQNLNELGADTSKQKLDLMVAQMESLRLQYDTMNERIQQIEKMVKELLDMAKSS